MTTKTPTDHISTLIHFQKWRRGEDDAIEQPDPKVIGEALDWAIKVLSSLELETVPVNEAKCWKCVGTGRVLGSGLYNYEPCPICRPVARERWEREKLLRALDENGKKPWKK